MSRTWEIRAGLLSAAVVALAAYGWTDAVCAAQIPGYLDPATGNFRPLTPGPTAHPSAKAVIVSGKVIIKVTAAIKSAIPADATLNAIGTVVINDDTYQDSVGNTFTLARTGNTATGTLTLPYHTAVASASDQMQVQLIISVSSSSGPRPFITLKHIIPLPADKASTTVKFAASL